MEISQTNDEQRLNSSLQALVAAHGYFKVLDHLVQVSNEEKQPPAKIDARYLMTLSPEEREPFLKASVDQALPAYATDRSLPETERQLTADLETGDFHDYETPVVGVKNG